MECSQIHPGTCFQLRRTNFSSTLRDTRSRSFFSTKCDVKCGRNCHQTATEYSEVSVRYLYCHAETMKINVSQHFCMFLVFSMSHERFQTKDQTRQRHISILGSSRKPLRRRQRKRHQTKGLIRKTITVHVRYNSLYISFPSSAKQQREMSAWSVECKLPHWSSFEFLIPEKKFFFFYRQLLQTRAPLLLLAKSIYYFCSVWSCIRSVCGDLMRVFPGRFKVDVFNYWTVFERHL